jgi:hypothetical protein
MRQNLCYSNARLVSSITGSFETSKIVQMIRHVRVVGQVHELFSFSFLS